MSVEIKNSGKALSELEITQTEKNLGLTLPNEYKKFLLIHNGGYPDLDAFPIQNAPFGQYGLLHQFLSIETGHNYSLEDYHKKYNNRIPDGFLPIACDPGGNLVCIATDGENIGKIYFWDHENEVEEGQTPNYDNVYIVANKFDELLESLMIPD